MGLTYHRFSLRYDATGMVGTDGQPYFNVTGKASMLTHISPSLIVPAHTIGASSHNEVGLLRYSTAVYILGRVIVYDHSIVKTVIVKHLIHDSWLGALLERLLEYAAAQGLLYPLDPYT